MTHTSEIKRLEARPFITGIHNATRVFIKPAERSQQRQFVRTLSRDEFALLALIRDKKPTYLEVVHRYLISESDQKLPIQQIIVTIDELIRGEIIKDVGLDPVESALPSHQPSPNVSVALPRLLVNMGLVMASILLLQRMNSFYLTQFAVVNNQLDAFAVWILPSFLIAVVILIAARLLNGKLHKLNRLRLATVKIFGLRVPCGFDDSDIFFVHASRALSYFCVELASPGLLSVSAMVLAVVMDWPSLIPVSFSFLLLTFWAWCPLVDGALHKLIKCLCVEDDLRLRTYQYLSKDAFHLSGLWKKRAVHSAGDEHLRWLPFYGTAAMLWLYLANVGLTDVLMATFGDLMSLSMLAPDTLTRASAGLLCFSFCAILFITVTTLVSIPIQNLRQRLQLPLRKARRRLFDYRVKGVSLSESIELFLRDISIFQHLDHDGLKDLSQRLVSQSVQPNRIIVKQGEQGAEFFIIGEGEADVYREGQRRVSLSVLRPGDSFGEIALINNVTRQATVKSRTKMELLILKRKDFDELFPMGSPLRAQLTQHINRSRLVGNCDGLSHLSSRQIAEFVSCCTSVDVASGDLVVRAGDEPDYVYVIEKGSFEVRLKLDDPAALASLGVGQVFGMIAVLNFGKRTASVSAVTPSTCLRIGRDDFVRICLANPLVATVLAGLSEQYLTSLREQHRAG